MGTKKITRKIKVIELDSSGIRKRYVYSGEESPSIAQTRKYYFTATDNVTRYFTTTYDLVRNESYFTFNTSTKVLTDKTGTQINYQTTAISGAAQLPWNNWVNAPKWSEGYIDIGAYAKNVYCEDGDSVEYKLANISPEPEAIPEEEIVEIFDETFSI